MVLTILAILAALLIPALTGYIRKAKEKAIITEATDTWKAAQAAMSECYAMYPETLIPLNRHADLQRKSMAKE